MRVHACCGYRGNSDQWGDDWKQVDWGARNIVKAIKREQFNGYSQIKFNGANYRVEDNAAGHEAAFHVAGEKLATLFDRVLLTDAVVVPIPSSQTTQPGGDYTGSRLAEGLQQRRPKLIATPALHFDTVQAKSHADGSRQWQSVLRHLRGHLPATQLPVVLLDDVLTTGGHARACAHYLGQQGHVVNDVFVIGRTLLTRPEKMFALPIEELNF